MKLRRSFGPKALEISTERSFPYNILPSGREGEPVVAPTMQLYPDEAEAMAQAPPDPIMGMLREPRS